MVREYALEHLAEDDAVLVVDETGFLKQGKASCGVARQYTGSAGKITNCQIGVFAAYVSRRRSWLYRPGAVLPKAWTSDPARMAGAQCHRTPFFATKPVLALAMIARAIAAGVVCLGHGRHRVRHGRNRDGVEERRQGLCAWRQWHQPVQFLGHRPPGCRDRDRDRQHPRSLCLAAVIGWSRRQGRAVVRLGLSGTGRS